jgi:hypothetical protein
MVWRTYECLDCEQMFEVQCAMDASDPDCPNCTKVLEWKPKSFAVGGSNESKAVDFTQKVMEQDYGLTNYRDNAKEGESGIVHRHETTVEREMVEREVRTMIEQTKENKVTNDFWGNNHGQASQLNSVTGQSMIANAKVGPQGPNPIAMLHDRAKGRVAASTTSMLKSGSKMAPFENTARKPGGG